MEVENAQIRIGANYNKRRGKNQNLKHSATKPQPKSKARPESLKHGGNGGQKI